MFPAAANIEGNLVLDDGATLDTLLHDGGAVVAGHHVQARLEQHRGGIVGADQAVSDDGAVVNELFAEEALLHPGRAARADGDVAARGEENIAALVRAHEALVQHLLVRDADHAVPSDDPLHRLAGVAVTHRTLLQRFA